MKLAVFDDYKIGVVRDGHLWDATDVTPDSLNWAPEQRINWLISEWETAQDKLLEIIGDAGRKLSLGDVTLRASSPDPRNIIGIPANYHAHLGELGTRSVSNGKTAREKGFFLKSPGSLVGAGEGVELPLGSERRFDHETELAVIIGKEARNVSRTEALDVVFGYSCLMDITMRIEPGQFDEERSMRKSFRSFTPLGPYLVTKDEVPAIENLTNRLWVNDELRQDALLSDMIVGLPEMIELITSVTTLRPGDVIATGTPAGVGQLKAGDAVKMEIPTIGTLELPVLQAATRAPWLF